MTEQTLRRSNWASVDPPSRRPPSEERPLTRTEDDPLAELARILQRHDPLAASLARDAAPAPAVAPQAQPQPLQRAVEPPVRRMPETFLGIDEAAFEAALSGPLPANAQVQPRIEPRAEARPEPRLPEIAPEPFDAAAHQELDAEFLAALDRELSTPDEEELAYEARRQAMIEAFLAEERAAAEARPEYAPDAHADRPPADPEQVAPPARTGAFAAGSGLVTVASVLGLVVLGAAGAVGYTMWTGGARMTGEPPVVRADQRPSRVAVEPQTQADRDANKIIFDRLAAQQQNPAAERVVPREEQPVTAAQPPQPAQPAPPPGQVSRVILPGGPQNGQQAEPRRVQTQTIRIRPDGTWESEATRPQQTPPNPAPPPAATQPPPQSAPPPVTGTLPAPAPAPAARVAAPQPQPAPPAPVERPVPPPARTAAVPPPAPAAPAPVPQPQAGRSGPFVQVASQPTEEGARQSFAGLQRRFPSILGSMQPNIRAVDLGERGTFHRVRVGPFESREAAAQLCTRLRAAGGDCVVAPN